MTNCSDMITVIVPSTPKRKPATHPVGPITPMTPEKTPTTLVRSSSRALKRTRNEENDPFSSSGTTLLPLTPERTPKRRRHTEYGPASGPVHEPAGVLDTPRRHRTRSRVSGFASDESDLSEGLA